MHTLLEFQKNVYSQNGEDGILTELFRRLEIQKGFAVEFGAWDGVHLSNSYNLIKNHGWEGLFIEGNEERYEDLLGNHMVTTGKIQPKNVYVLPHGETSLESILSESNVKMDFDLLSIDIDSIDLYIWKSLKSYQPKVVVIEINSSIPSEVGRILQNGALEKSFQNTLSVGKGKGYTLVCHTGNMIFVRNDLVSKLEMMVKNPYGLFLTSWVRKEPGYLKKIKRNFLGKSLENFIYWHPKLQQTSYRILCPIDGIDDELILSTSRPELLFTCKAILINPTDTYHFQFVGKEVVIPLSGHKVPIIAHPYANPEFETGVVMVSSYADTGDSTLFIELDLIPEVAIDEGGRMTRAVTGYYGKLALQAQTEIVAALKWRGLILKESPLIPVDSIPNTVFF